MSRFQYPASPELILPDLPLEATSGLFLSHWLKMTVRNVPVRNFWSLLRAVFLFLGLAKGFFLLIFLFSEGPASPERENWSISVSSPTKWTTDTISDNTSHLITQSRVAILHRQEKSLVRLALHTDVFIYILWILVLYQNDLEMVHSKYRPLMPLVIFKIHC